MANTECRTWESFVGPRFPEMDATSQVLRISLQLQLLWWCHADRPSVWLTRLCVLPTVLSVNVVYLEFWLSSLAPQIRASLNHTNMQSIDADLLQVWTCHAYLSSKLSGVRCLHQDKPTYQKELSFLQPFLTLVPFQPIYSFCGKRLRAW